MYCLPPKRETTPCICRVVSSPSQSPCSCDQIALSLKAIRMVRAVIRMQQARPLPETGPAHGRRVRSKTDVVVIAFHILCLFSTRVSGFERSDPGWGCWLSFRARNRNRFSRKRASTRGPRPAPRFHMAAIWWAPLALLLLSSLAGMRICTSATPSSTSDVLNKFSLCSVGVLELHITYL
jgi:hypothetical protein